ncbi:protease [Actinomadura sp. KC06]|uniref:SSI family serine proteinase inhibitor n=1 Tax=Actinomadura sp. KC06 TaxID=2530369 RepID=UPI0010447B65|nr:SSI family serine proteinase inhibitor [Actinomadura sp. KC06]TDD23338.1 protease [Actinomadura sp. KC06]
MARVTLRVVLGLSLVAGGVAAAAPAVAADSPGAPTEIKLEVVPQQSGQPRFATLTCDPVGGTHKNAKAACAELALVNGDIARVPPQTAGCLQVWIPVDAAAAGTWRGMPIKPFSRTITNDGCARIAHGHVFDF